MSFSRRNVSAEPFTGADLAAFLRDKGAEPVNQRGTHIKWRFPNGQTVPMVPESAQATNLVARAIAKACGMTYPELRSALKRPIPVRNKGRFEPSKPPEKRIGKRTVLRAIDDLRYELDEIEQEIRQGDRDASVYERAHTAVVAAIAEAANFRVTNNLIRSIGDAPTGDTGPVRRAH